MASSINASTSGAGGVITTADNSGVLNLQSGGTTVATVSSTGFSTPANQTINTANTFGFKNRIINGGMTIDQRNAGAATTVTGAYGPDRFIVNQNQNYTTLALSTQQVTDAPSNFTNSLKLTISTGQATSATRTITAADQRIEGYNFADFGFGTANAKTFTISFWVKSNTTGTYPISFFNSGVTRAYLASYTISSANTWEQKTVTVAGDTSGTWNTTNGIGIGIQWGVAVGSNGIGTTGSWSATYKQGVSGMVDLGATTGNTWQLTGVQLEVGSQATSFDFRDYGRELIMCQRYYATNMKANGFTTNGTTDCALMVIFPTQMRTTPTLGVTGALGVYDGGANYTQSVAGSGTFYGSIQGGMIIPNNFSGLTNYRPVSMNNNASTASITASAEL